MSVGTPLIDTNPRALMAISNELHDVLEPSRHHILVKGAAYKSFISQNPSIESAGMGFSTKLSGNANFISRAALEAQYAAAGVDRRRVLLSVEDPDDVLMGLEPIFVDGETHYRPPTAIQWGSPSPSVMLNATTDLSARSSKMQNSRSKPLLNPMLRTHPSSRFTIRRAKDCGLNLPNKGICSFISECKVNEPR